MSILPKNVLKRVSTQPSQSLQDWNSCSSLATQAQTSIEQGHIIMRCTKDSSANPRQREVAWIVMLWLPRKHRVGTQPGISFHVQNSTAYEEEMLDRHHNIALDDFPVMLVEITRKLLESEVLLASIDCNTISTSFTMIGLQRSMLSPSNTSIDIISWSGSNASIIEISPANPSLKCF